MLSAIVTTSSIENLTAWFDASELSTITETLGNISQWDDKSRNNHHAIQPVSTTQPLSNSSSQNGLNVIDFLQDDTFELPTQLHLLPLGSNTIFAVAKTKALLNNHRY